MSWYRLETRARLEDRMTEGRIDGSALRLVTPAPPVVSHLRPSEARDLAFCLLELAEVAERRSEPEE